MKNKLPRLACSHCVQKDAPSTELKNLHLQVDVAEEATRNRHRVSDANSRRLEMPAEQPYNFPGPRTSLRGFEQFRASHGHSRNGSTASRRSGSIDQGTVNDTLSRHDSAATNAQTWHARLGEQQDLETTLLSYSIEKGEATYKYQENGIGDGALKMILYRSTCEQAWGVTRRLVIIDPDGELQTTTVFSNWLPLADLKLHLYDDTCLLYTSPSPRDGLLSRMPSSA